MRPTSRTPIRLTSATRRRYPVLIWTELLTILGCAALSLLLEQTPLSIVAPASGAVALIAIGLAVFERSRSTYDLIGTVLQSRGLRGRRADLAHVVTASIETREQPWLGRNGKWATLQLVDATGKRVRTMITSQRITHLYEPDDVRLIAEVLTRSTSPQAQDVARYLRSIADQGSSGH